MNEILVALVLSVIMVAFGFFKLGRPAPPNNKDFLPVENIILEPPKNKRRDELILYITNKSLDSYEDKLLVELRRSSDMELMTIASSLQLMEETLPPKKDRNV